MRKILVVDDERHIVRFVQVNLECAEYEVVTASNGKDALENADICSGKGASKSSGIVNSPAHSPKGRCCWATEATGLSSAIGRSACIIRTISPALTRRKYPNRSRCISSTLIVIMF